MKTYSLLIILSVLFRKTNVQGKYSAVCFLTNNLESQTLQFAEELAQDAVQYGVDVLLMIDNNTFKISTVNASSNIRLLQIENEECIKYGYQNAISHKIGWRTVTAWDKALLYFCLLNRSYSFVWLIEYDVFIPSAKAFRSLHELYSNTNDLVVSRNTPNLLGSIPYHTWNLLVGKFVPPWFQSMVNAVGLSRRMLTAITDYVRWRGVVPFHEFFFNILAIQLNMTIVTPTELSALAPIANYSFDQILMQPNNLWHPVKDLDKHKQWRKMLANEDTTNNITIQLNDLGKLCSTNRSMESIRQHLINLLLNLEIVKSQLSLDIRRSMRQQILNPFVQCQKHNASSNITLLAMKVANHVYKLPEAPMVKLVTKKSPNHLKLEQALKENKEAIFRLPSHASTVAKLRHQANKLIDELTIEIRREVAQQQKLQNSTQLWLSYFLSANQTINATIQRTFSSRRKLHNVLGLIQNKLKRFLLIILIITSTATFVILWWSEVQGQKYFLILLICIYTFCFYWYTK